MKEATTTNLLITIYLPAEHVGILDGLTRCALSSLEVCGLVEHNDLGVFHRASSKADEADVLKLLTATMKPAAGRDGHDLARGVEAALRTNLKAAGVPPNDRVRVFVA